jgi:hypothetical protein
VILCVAPGVKVYLTVDMRRGFDGLSADVARILAAEDAQRIGNRDGGRTQKGAIDRSHWVETPGLKFLIGVDARLVTNCKERASGVANTFPRMPP